MGHKHQPERGRGPARSPIASGQKRLLVSAERREPPDLEGYVAALIALAMAHVEKGGKEDHD